MTDSELVVSQLQEHQTKDVGGTTTLLAVYHATVGKRQANNSIYPYFFTLAGPAGESLEVQTSYPIYVSTAKYVLYAFWGFHMNILSYAKCRKLSVL